MRFFEYNGVIEDWERPEEDMSLRDKREKNREIALKSSAFNEDLQGKAFFYVAGIYENRVKIGIICREPDTPDKQVQEYLAAAGMRLRDTALSEMTLKALSVTLHHAEREEFIDDAGGVLEEFGLDEVLGGNGRYLWYGESLIGRTSREKDFAAAERILARDSLLPELERIYEVPAKKKTCGHPVQYMVTTDDPDMRNEVCRILLRALYRNGRLLSRRFVTVDVQTDSEAPEEFVEALYKSSTGGCVVIRFPADERAEDEYANSAREMIELLCGTMKRYSSRVLTVLCLPHGSGRIRDMVLDCLFNICLIELKEEYASGERAESFLRSLARENRVRPDKKLFAGLEEGKGYLAPELREMFGIWYGNKLRTGVYPQYREMTTVKREVLKAAPKGSAYDELMGMVGLEEAKKIIGQVLDFGKAQKLSSAMGIKTDRPAMHMVFTGNPGTAKTSVARLFAGIMRENRLLSRGNLIEVGRAELVGKYVGWTAPEIKKKFRQAQGNVLFIDEAYSLADGREGSFGDEAINTIVQEMENHREDTVVIFAGYPDKMEAFLDKNPGLRSRIAFHVPFEDYDAGELCRIADLLAKQKGLKLTGEARGKLGEVFEAAMTEKNFGNGRFVRNVLEKARMAQASRLMSMDPDSIGKTDLVTIRAEDIEMPEPGQKTVRIGFCA